jgi:tetratricopeptide (TPR) repeat protein
MTKRLITIFTLIIAATAVLFLGSQMPSLAATSASDDATLATAGQLYRNGQPALAAQSFQQLVDQGYGGSALYFNLGRAYQQQGEPGRAIVNYRRALELAPRDGDIATALAEARAQVAAQSSEPPAAAPGVLTQLGQVSSGWLTLNEAAVLALAAWVLFALLVIAFTSSRQDGRLRRGLRYAVAAAAIALTLSVIGLGSRMHAAYGQPQAVIVAGPAELTVGPGQQFATLASLPAGSEVTLRETRGPWSRISAPAAGVEGWVAANLIETVW